MWISENVAPITTRSLQYTYYARCNGTQYYCRYEITTEPRIQPPTSVLLNHPHSQQTKTRDVLGSTQQSEHSRPHKNNPHNTVPSLRDIVDPRHANLDTSSCTAVRTPPIENNAIIKTKATTSRLMQIDIQRYSLPVETVSA